jgi:long-chain fatty acid transport protein
MGCRSPVRPHSTLALPDSTAFGLTFYPTRVLSWEVGAVWTKWSEYNQLQFGFDQPILRPGAQMITIPKNWHDTWRFQTGVEYKACSWLDLRAGYIYDQEAIDATFADYELPSNNRHYFSVGPGFHWNKWTMDLSYTYTLIQDRDIPNSLSPGYINPTSLTDGHAHLVGASLGYRFW